MHILFCLWFSHLCANCLMGPFTLFDFGLDFLCFLVCIPNLVKWGFWALEVFLFHLLVLSDLEFVCVLLLEKSRYCPEVMSEYNWGLASLATLPSRFMVSVVITGLSHVLYSVLVSLFANIGENVLFTWGFHWTWYPDLVECLDYHTDFVRSPS